MNKPFYYGADISFLEEIEQAGGMFYEGDTADDCLEILKNNGVNSIRLRLWNNPEGEFCNLDHTLAMAKRIKEKGMHLLLCFHYSDEWADPKHQKKPKDWIDLDTDALKHALFDYTRSVVSALVSQGTKPDMVQIGNEITMGILWEDGCVTGELRHSDEQWSKFTDFVRTGAQAVKSVDSEINVMVHVDQGGKNDVCRFVLDQFEKHNVQYDSIGLSFYPWWHGTLQDLEANLSDLALRYEKDIAIIEVAYPWNIENPLNDIIIVQKEEQLHTGYPATQEGQAAYIRNFIELIQRTPNNRCIGFHYWEPCWIPFKEQWSVGHLNNWSNLTLFDYEGRSLPALAVIRELSQLTKMEAAPVE
ncbi:arabinogalactan endo-1,4-beta-galactosidase [Paenibacillus cellulosilyticus]|uniref:Arabinogalactan endo-beta-1,4-galactanase n=1 Tax=Paenibacillus cellulosilyticus TaxID=375489 RepID=A0A2V2YNE3_9BACL|nr:glycosyl hydrolase 53 family protein [Paenibacillus cellulosilyticus]PWV95916.1 arabinogalactan endo-1,4-beta-galactosidase [Paenibacillus cellulosilyticus]QKS47781.1 glycosyl hydrolase 53 family protein [Paenibacillus cellulosilyticus]